MFSNTYFGPGNSGSSGSGGGGGGLTTTDVNTIVQNTVNSDFVKNLDVRSALLKDTRTFPTDLPPAKYARLYETPSLYTDKVFACNQADTATTATTATNSNQLGGIVASSYALTSAIPTAPDLTPYTKKFVTGDASTQHTVYESTRLNGRPATDYALTVNIPVPPDLSSYSKKFVNGDASTEHIVYESTRLNGLPGSAYALTSAIPTAPDLSSYTKKFVSGDVSTQHIVYESTRLNGRPASDYALTSSIPTSVSTNPLKWRILYGEPYTTGNNSVYSFRNASGAVDWQPPIIWTTDESSWDETWRKTHTYMFVATTPNVRYVLPFPTSTSSATGWASGVVSAVEINIYNDKDANLEVATYSTAVPIRCRITPYNDNGASNPTNLSYVKISPRAAATFKFLNDSNIKTGGAYWIVVGSFV